jgi:type II secretion system protein G
MKRGFTLIELMIIIVIMGVLAALISGNFITSLKKGRDARRKADLEEIQRALEMYYEDNRAYPLTAGLVFGNALTNQAENKTYMVKVPKDPSGRSYQYISADGTSYKLFACLENNLQILPYVSSGHTFTCSSTCKDQADATVTCVWGVSSSNTAP